MSEAAVKTSKKSSTQSVEPKKFNVVIMNDSITPMDFVIDLIRQHFHYDHARCYDLMMQIHEQGQATVATYYFELAEQKALECTYHARRQGFPLEIKVVPS
jgi:ATP-dependent Clp protease adaptor protein ClpS